MGLIPQVKCGRCDRTYSGLRSRCPYCGARRHNKGKRVSDGDNATWKLIIGILLIVVLIAAVIVIVVTSPKDTDKDPGDTKGGGTSDPSNLPGINNPSDGSTEITVTDADGVTVTTLTVQPDGTVDLTAVVTSDTDVTPVWTSSDETVAKVEATDDTGLKIRVTGVAAGSAVITGTAGDAKVEIGVTCGDAVDPGPGTTTPPSGTVLASSITVASQYSGGKAITDVKLAVGEKCTFTATITPSTATGKVTWTISDPSGAEIVPTDDTGIKVRITCLKAVGTVTVTAEIDGVSYSFLLRCRST